MSTIARTSSIERPIVPSSAVTLAHCAGVPASMIVISPASSRRYELTVLSSPTRWIRGAMRMLAPYVTVTALRAVPGRASCQQATFAHTFPGKPS